MKFENFFTPERIFKKVYNCLCCLHSSSFTTWVSNVHSMLITHDFIACWERQSCVNSDILEFKRTISDQYMYHWSSSINDINTNPKLRTYCQFKSVFECESYLLTIKDFRLQQLLTKFRISDHCLEIEVGRHNNIPADNRICNHCDILEVEDEKHFLLRCDLYCDLREVLIQHAGSCNFTDIMCNQGLQFNLAKCIFKMFRRRKLRP